MATLLLVESSRDLKDSLGFEGGPAFILWRRVQELRKERNRNGR